MKMHISAAAALTILALLCAPCLAAQGDAIKTDYFSITPPTGWSMPAPVKEQPHGGASAAFTRADANIAVTLNVLRIPMTAQQLAENMARDMAKNGLKASKPMRKDGMVWLKIEGKAPGQAWFGSNGELCAATLIFGPEPKQANELLRAIQSPCKGLFPIQAN